MEISGDLSQGFEGACNKILDSYADIPISLESDLGGIPVEEMNKRVEETKNAIIAQAKDLAPLRDSVVVKIPLCQAGIEALKEIHRIGIRTNVTACMTPFQAIEAAKAGATYVSLFANRMLDTHVLEMAGYPSSTILTHANWKEIVAEHKPKHFDKAWDKTLDQIAYVAAELEKNHPNTELIVGSIRSPDDIHKIAKAHPQVITIPTKIVQGLINSGVDMKELKDKPRSHEPQFVVMGDSLEHPMTTFSIDEFEQSAAKYRGYAQ